MDSTPVAPAADPALDGLQGLVREPFSRRGVVMTGLMSQAPSSLQFNRDAGSKLSNLA
ncbi:hypothetical protein V5F77_04870 [Xanthobacter sp. DSM 24535]|uniref:hypothetical protein n=1 Tax=Roseixanthobacter psychrophilus TaxID=3119917 RepID=UPI00372A6466